jgi:Fe-S cluster assembly protein SufD
VPPLSAFTAEAVSVLPGPAPLKHHREAAYEQFCRLDLPKESEELWRYSPIDRLDLDAYGPVARSAVAPEGIEGMEDVDDLAAIGTLVTVIDGAPVLAGASPRGLVVEALSARHDAPALLGQVATDDALVALHHAFLPDAVVIEVGDGVVLDRPVVVVHFCPAGPDTLAPASFPHLVIHCGRNAQAQVVEVVAGARAEGPALVLPVTTAQVAEAGRLSYVSLQVLGLGAWHLGRLQAEVATDATLRAFSAGLGGAYDRARTDVAVLGRGGSSQLRSVYLGTGSQIHDVRTLQDHAAPSTTSDLLCKGAVTGSARSIYSGLIKVRPGAVKTDAMQTNHNLVLGPHAHADSVPNLDIEENDVRCSHASTVGPVDADQLYYLESRGIPPERAERLIVLGFFDDVVDRCPVPAVRRRLQQEVGTRLMKGLAEDAELAGAGVG